MAAMVAVVMTGVVEAAQLSGEQVYKTAAAVTFLLEVSDSSGSVVATGTGFLISPTEILTNAHVASKGTISVRIGSTGIMCSVKRLDIVNDLAICEIAARNDARPLVLAPADPMPGATVFALGNPLGLENTITQGLFSGIRELEGRRVAQISAAISTGSSGGPILNTEGQIVGVAVLFLRDGQALSFAVPLGVVREFVSGGPSAADTTSDMSRARAWRIERNALHPKEPKWSELDTRFRTMVEDLIYRTEDIGLLNELYDLADPSSNLPAEAARKVLRIAKTPTREMMLRLAEALYAAGHEPGPSPALQEAEDAASRAVDLASEHDAAADLSLLADIQLRAGKTLPAHSTLLKASTLAKPNTPETARIFMRLFRTSRDLNQVSEAERWFKKAASTAAVDVWDWARYAEFLNGRLRFSEAAAAWMNAFKDAGWYRYICEASSSYYFANDFDDGLTASRKCINLASEPNAMAHLVEAHNRVSDMLHQRGVYDEAANHARQAVTLDPSNAFAHLHLADALVSQRRFTEAIATAKTALRLADGKYSSMHFVLGRAYFGLEQWHEAGQAFTKAAERDARDWSAAYNVAVSYYNSHYHSEALKWYREALRRDPNSTRKDHILRMIERLSKQ
jgi:tetratricopeptide (TPR) repeat protein